jgi:SPP1 family predicted phage head-tail adaptor
MPNDEFPHAVTFKQLQTVPDGGGGSTKVWVDYATIDGFMDTPSSREVYEAHQLNNPLDRHLYYPHRTDISTTMRVLYESETYEVTGRPQDQGGMQEVMRLPLRLVMNG